MLEREHQQVLENTEVRATDHSIAHRLEREPGAIEATRSSSAEVPLFRLARDLLRISDVVEKKAPAAFVSRGSFMKELGLYICVMPRRIALVIAVLLAGCASSDEAARLLPQPSAWKAVLIAGDTAEPAFDNAVDAMAAKLEGYGLRPQDIVTLKASGSGRLKATRTNIQDAFSTLAPAPSDGCFVFITSHGVPRRGLFMKAIGSTLSPRELDTLLDRSCADRPTVVIASGCFSGVFATGWSMPAPNRTILTAAQSNRASFGCNAQRRFTVFDQCVLENLEAHQVWKAVMDRVRGCVSRIEQRTNYSPPSDPQISIGRKVEALTAF